MPTAEAHIGTAHPSRYLVQLCRHAASIKHRGIDFMKHKGPHLHVGETPASPELLHVEWSDTFGTLSLNWGRCAMQAGPDMLTLRVEAADDEKLQRIQDILTRDLERFGRRDELQVNWRRSEAPTP